MSLLIKKVRLELIVDCFPNKDADKDNGDVFWDIVKENEEDDASESEVVPGEAPPRKKTTAS